MNFYEVVKKETQTLAPSSFAIVMSTGIISIACHLLEYNNISYFLFYLANIEYALLIVLFFIRLFSFFPQVTKDLSTHAKGAGLLTVTAASCILGLQYVLLKNNFSVAVALWFFALFFWFIFMYAFFILAMIKKEKPSPEDGLNGSWLLLVVSTQSLSILANTLLRHLPFSAEVTTFTAFGCFLMGFLLYVIIITLTFQRLIFSPLKPEEFTPPDWIDMGAAAITALSGATLANAIKDTVPFDQLMSFVKSISMLAWIVATWWIPVVFILEIRRHIYQKNSFKYQAAYWSLVFPLGVYTVCTIRLSEALPFAPLHTIAEKFIFIALIVWTVVFIAMVLHLLKLASSTNELANNMASTH